MNNEISLRVENYGYVRPHQSFALNYHLQTHLETFDILFEQSGGIIGSLSHQFEREIFAKSACESLINSVKDNPYELNELITDGKHESGSLGRVITIKTKSTFDKASALSDSLPTFKLN